MKVKKSELGFVHDEFREVSFSIIPICLTISKHGDLTRIYYSHSPVGWLDGYFASFAGPPHLVAHVVGYACCQLGDSERSSSRLHPVVW